MKRFIFLSILLFIISDIALAQDATQEQQPRCALKLNQAPELRGLKLGMTAEQILARFPGLKIHPADKYGYRKVGLIFTPSDLAVRDGVMNFEQSTYISTVKFPDYKGLKSAGLQFLDDHIFSIQLVYDDSVKWQDLDEFIEKVATSLNLPKDWQEDETESEKYLQCDGFQVAAALSGYTGPTLRVSDLVTLLVIRERKAEKEEKQRSTFKPD